MKRKLLALITVLACLGVVGPVTAASADYGPTAQYQIAFSFNCNNPGFCGADQLGGFWGWAVFNTDGTADAELTGCGHIKGFGGGAQHFDADVDGWFIGPNGDFFTVNETDTFVGRTTGTQFLPGPNDTGIPAAPGHYSTSELLGFTPPPGVAFQVQVVKIPNR